MSEINDLYVGSFGIVVTVKTEASLVDVTLAALEIKYPKVNFTGISEDGITFVDGSNEINGLKDDDVSLLPSGQVDIGDAYYFGLPGRFNGINLDISQEGAGSWVLTWEYVQTDGTWGALLSVTDNTSNFTVKGENSITYTLPTDWEKAVVNNSESLYFIRARVTTADASPTQQPKAAIVNIAKNSLAGNITNSDAIAGDDDFGKFTVTIIDGTFEFEGTYFTQAKLTTDVGNFLGKVVTLPIKKLFGQ